MLFVLYASETGTAAEYAERLAAGARSLCVPHRLLPLDEAALSLVAQHAPARPTLALLVSTCGDGEVPRASRGAWGLLLSAALPESLFAGARLAVLALGDAGYERYNWAGKRVHRRLLQLGAAPVAGLGTDGRIDSDAQHPLGHDDAFVPFVRAVLGCDPPASTLPRIRVAFCGGCRDERKTLVDSDSAQPESDSTLRAHSGTEGGPMDENIGGDSVQLESDSTLCSICETEENAMADDIARDSAQPESDGTFRAYSGTEENVLADYMASDSAQVESDSTLRANSGTEGKPMDENIGGDPADASPLTNCANAEVERVESHGNVPGKSCSRAALDERQSASHGHLPVFGDAPYCGVVDANARLTPADHWQDVRLVRISARGDDAAAIASGGWPPGAAAVLHAPNADGAVGELLSLLGWAGVADAPLAVDPVHPDAARDVVAACAGRRATLRGLLTWHLDVVRPPRRHFFAALCAVVSQWDDVCVGRFDGDSATASIGSGGTPGLPNESSSAGEGRPIPGRNTKIYAEKIRELASAAGADDLSAYVSRARRTPAHVLRELLLPALGVDAHAPGAVAPAGAVPVHWVADLFPPLSPRLFSVASLLPSHVGGPVDSSVVDPGQSNASPCTPHVAFEIVVAVVEYASAAGIRTLGQCSGWLRASAPCGTPLRFGLAPGTLPRIPAGVPLLAVCAGTGIAPVRALLQQRYALGAACGATMVVHGFRNKGVDDLFSAEMRAHAARGMRYVPLGSRDGAARRHVDAALRADADAVRGLLSDSRAHVVVAGNAHLPALVKRALAEVCGAPRVSELLSARRLHIECW